VPDSVRDILLDQESAQLRKVLYRWGAWAAHVAVVDIATKSVLVDLSSTALEPLVAEYLWIPLAEARPDELRDVTLCPFRYELL